MGDAVVVAERPEGTVAGRSTRTFVARATTLPAVASGAGSEVWVRVPLGPTGARVADVDALDLLGPLCSSNLRAATVPRAAGGLDWIVPITPAAPRSPPSPRTSTTGQRGLTGSQPSPRFRASPPYRFPRSLGHEEFHGRATNKVHALPTAMEPCCVTSPVNNAGHQPTYDAIVANRRPLAESTSATAGRRPAGWGAPRSPRTDSPR